VIANWPDIALALVVAWLFVELAMRM